MRLLLLIFHLLITLTMIGVILLQKGEDASSGASVNPTGGLFSARGSKNLLTRTTAILSGLFFLNCLVLAILVRNEGRLKPTHQPAQSNAESMTKKQPSRQPLEKRPIK